MEAKKICLTYAIKCYNSAIDSAISSTSHNLPVIMGFPEVTPPESACLSVTHYLQEHGWI